MSKAEVDGLNEHLVRRRMIREVACERKTSQRATDSHLVQCFLFPPFLQNDKKKNYKIPFRLGICKFLQKKRKKTKTARSCKSLNMKKKNRFFFKRGVLESLNFSAA